MAVLDKTPWLGFLHGKIGIFYIKFIDYDNFNIYIRRANVTSQIENADVNLVLEELFNKKPDLVWGYSLNIPNLLYVTGNSYQNSFGLDENDLRLLVNLRDVIITSTDSSDNVVNSLKVAEKIEKHFNIKALTQALDSLDYLSQNMGVQAITII